MATHNLHRVLILTEGPADEATDAIGEMLRTNCATLSGSDDTPIVTWQFEAPYTAQALELPRDMVLTYDTDLEALDAFAVDDAAYREAWKAEVANGDTVRGFAEWKQAAIEEGREV